MTADAFHLGWFLSGFKVHSWNGTWSGTGARDWNSTAFYVDFVRSLERACFDYVLLEDSSFVPDAYGDSAEVYLRHALMIPKQDPAVLAGILTQATSRLGIVPTLSTSEYPPYLLARLISTLDHVSHGRAGWNIVTGSSDRAAQNYGRDALPDHEERYAIADEFADLVTQLWGSWDEDAVVADVEGGVFADHTKVHTVDFEGRYFRSRGPLVTSRPPQGRPVIVQAGGSPRGRDFASKYADTIIAYVREPHEMKEFRADIHARLLTHGRKPADCKVLFLVTPTLGDTEQEAWDRKRRADQALLDMPEKSLAMMGFTTNIDFSRFDVDTPVRDLAAGLSTNGHQSVLDHFVHRAGDRTLREVAAERQSPDVVGTPDQVAGQLAELMEEVGGDGFLFTLPETNRKTVAEVTDGLVPVLQRRGLTRSSYTHEHFRDNLLEF